MLPEDGNNLALTPTLSPSGEGWSEGERSANIFQTDTLMKRNSPLLLALLLTAGCASIGKTSRNTGPWDMAALKQAPLVEWGARTGLVQEVFYQGEPFHGKPTRVFAYVGRPSTGTGPYPAMVLVHGGGGKAFREWAEHWAKRGYVVLAMDTAGCGPNGPLPDGGPGQDDTGKFGWAANTWESAVLKGEMESGNLVAWLRNFPRSFPTDLRARLSDFAQNLNWRR